MPDEQAPADPQGAPIQGVHRLRRLWRPHKERLLAARPEHPTHMRFHRCCSWLQQVEAMADAEGYPDSVLIYQWIALNALFGQWDSGRAEPKADGECWRQFLGQVLKLDRRGLIAAVLTEHRKLVLALLDDAWLGGYFWRDPSVERALRTQRDKREALTWYHERRWGLILEHVVGRIYFLRCQLVHGGATYNSQLNRTSARRCTIMLGHLLPAILEVWIDRGADHDWGPICYPPQG